MYIIIVTLPTGSQETSTIRGPKQAYAAYDNAVRLGYYVDAFHRKGSDLDMRDMPQAAAVQSATCSCGAPGGVYGHELACGTVRPDENPDAAQDAWEQAQRDNDREPWYTRVDDGDLTF